MSDLISVPLRPTMLPLVVLHAYADVESGTHWNCVFDPRHPASHEPTNAILAYCVIWHRIVAQSLSDGHHQIAVVDFPDGTPEMIAGLDEDAQREDVGYIGLCDHTSIDSITTHLNGG
ncbi:hypothetical protein [Novipirellula sp.]|uniref:hypothetical protein n=1 Tax=Novipirellula sp. TaxID=2795430 RepID=UPI00356AEE5E